MRLVPENDEKFIGALLHYVAVYVDRSPGSVYPGADRYLHPPRCDWLPARGRQTLPRRVNRLAGALRCVVADIQRDEGVIGRIGPVHVLVYAEDRDHPRFEIGVESSAPVTNLEGQVGEW